MLGINWQTILFHVFNFALLVLLLNEFMYEPILEFINKREEEIKSKQLEINDNLEKSKKLVEEHNLKMDEINIEAENIKKEAIAEAKLLAKEEIENAKKEGKKIIEDSRAEAIIERDIMIRNSKKDLRDVAYEAAAKIAFIEDNAYEDFIDHTEEVENGR